MTTPTLCAVPESAPLEQAVQSVPLEEENKLQVHRRGRQLRLIVKVQVHTCEVKVQFKNVEEVVELHVYRQHANYCSGGRNVPLKGFTNNSMS